MARGEERDTRYLRVGNFRRQLHHQKQEGDLQQGPVAHEDAVLLRGHLDGAHVVGDVVCLAGGADVEEHGEHQKEHVGLVVEQLPQVQAALFLLLGLGRRLRLPPPGAGVREKKAKPMGISINSPEIQKVFSTPTKGSRAEIIRLPTVNRKDPMDRSRP